MAVGRAAARRKSNPGRVIGIAAVAAALLLIGVVVMSSFGGSDQPAYQERVSVPGAGEHFVNLWVDEAGSGARQLTAQIADVGGWPAGASSVLFTVTGQGQEAPAEAQGVYSSEGPGRGQVYRANLAMPGQGPWDISVRFVLAGESADAVFTVVE